MHAQALYAKDIYANYSEDAKHPDQGGAALKHKTCRSV
jgi:hypothetical protein